MMYVHSNEILIDQSVSDSVPSIGDYQMLGDRKEVLSLLLSFPLQVSDESSGGIPLLHEFEFQIYLSFSLFSRSLSV